MLKASLQLRTAQHLTLTPQLQQAIRLLQLSTLELEQEIEQVLRDNPLLEREDEPAQVSLHADNDMAGGSDAPSQDAPEPAQEVDMERDSTTGGEDAPPMRETDSLWNDLPASRGDDDDEPSGPQIAASTATLREHLLEQLSVTLGSARDKALAQLLIDALDDNGYLSVPLEEVAEMLPAELEVDQDELRTALALVQSFDPPGVGARDTAECIGLQLRHPDVTRLPEARDPSVLSCARAIARSHLPLLAARDYAKLRRSLKCDDDTLRAAQSLIRRLTPRPGSQFSATAADYVVPDVVVRKLGKQWVVHLNSEAMPRLRINHLYAQLLKSDRSCAHAGMSAQLQEARWLIRNVRQRFDTILRVSQAIVDRQHGFFDHGEVAMRPLVLREIADTLGLHESTISRVTTQKYMLTPFGTIELKHFFGSHVATETGGAASSTAIRALIKQLVSAEDPTQPLSDSQLAQTLGEQGIVVARRTVAKYREALQIPPVSLRKSI